MASKAFERLGAVSDRQTLRLTHYGRKTGRPYEVTVWFLVDDGRFYLISANANRGWVRNVKKRPGVSLQIGEQIFNGDVREIIDQQEREHVNNLVERKYWLLMPLMRLGRLLTSMGLVRDNSAAFEVILSDS